MINGLCTQTLYPQKRCNSLGLNLGLKIIQPYVYVCVYVY